MASACKSVVATIVLLLAMACSSGSAIPESSTRRAPEVNPVVPLPAATITLQHSSEWVNDWAQAAKSLRADQEAWDRFKEAAKREGRVVVSGPGFPGLRNSLTEGFQRAHGLTLEYLGLAAGEVITRVDRESTAGNVTIDVNLGGVSTCWAMAERGQVDAIDKLIVDPSLFNPSLWSYGFIRISLPSPSLPSDFYCGLHLTDWVLADLFVNSDIVKADSLQSWNALLQPEYKGKIASFDPRRPGSSQGTVGYLNALFGEQYLRDLYIGQEVTLTADYRQLAEWVARGSYPIGIGLIQTNIEPLRAEGLPLERVFPADGPGLLTGGFGVAEKIKGGPNPNAGAVFLNWLASQEAQEIWERELMETSLRTDVAHRVPDYVIPKPGADYTFNDYHPGYFFKHRAQAIERIQDLLGR